MGTRCLETVASFFRAGGHLRRELQEQELYVLIRREQVSDPRCRDRKDVVLGRGSQENRRADVDSTLRDSDGALSVLVL